MKSSQEHLEGGIITMPAIDSKREAQEGLASWGTEQVGVSHWNSMLLACPLVMLHLT